jgi:hypothetical protein
MIFDLTRPHANRYPELVRASTRARRTMNASLEVLVKTGVFHGDPELLGLAFWAAMHGLVVLHLADKQPGEHDFETIRREVMRLLVIGARAV